MNNEQRTKIELLEKAGKLLTENGYLESGRKSRSDKGKSRQSYDLNNNCQYMKTYKMVLSKLLSKANKNDDDLFILYDCNGYYVDIDRVLVPTYGEFKTIKDGKTESRRVKYNKSQSAVDLEFYRFYAWKEMATRFPNEIVSLPNSDLLRWAMNSGLSKIDADNYFKKRQFTWLSLFCAFYHIDELRIDYWEYEYWKECYIRCPKIELQEDFKFSLKYMPGSTEFMPEWSYINDKLNKEIEQKQLDDHEKRVWNGKVSYNRKKP